MYSFGYTRRVSSRDLLQCIVPVVSNPELCARTFVKGVAFLFSVLTSIITRKKRAGGIFWRCDGYVYYFDCDDNITGLVIYQNSAKGTQSFKRLQYFLRINFISIKLLRLIFLQREKKCHV